MSNIPDEFTGEYYDSMYFSDPEGKAYFRSDGSIEHWGYKNKEGEFFGAKDVAKAWKTMFNPKNALDVGAGRGTFIAYMRDFGIKASGFDYSKYAVSDKGRYPRCKKEWLIEHDATKPWSYPDKSFDLVTGLDIMEHLYLPDIDFVINEMFRVAKKHIFLQIAVSGSGGLQGENKSGYVLKKGEPVPAGLQGCAVAGHVTLCNEIFWIDRLEREDWIIRRDLKEWFCSLVKPEIVRNWLLNSIIVLSHEEEELTESKLNAEITYQDAKRIF